MDEKVIQKIESLPTNVRPLFANTEEIIGGGANCWNATRMYHEPWTAHEFCPTEDMEVWLTVNTVPVEGPRQRGDILVLRLAESCFWYPSRTLWHTAVYLDETHMFHKYGCYGKYSIQEEEEVKRGYPDAELYEWRRYVSAPTQAKAA